MKYRILFADHEACKKSTDPEFLTELRIIIYEDSTVEAPDNDVPAAAVSTESGFINILRAICNAADDCLINNTNAAEHDKMLENICSKIHEHYSPADGRTNKNEADEIIQCIGLKRQDSIIGRICAFMLENMDNKSIMELAADKFGISKDHIRRIFKVKLGMTSNEVLIRLKIERAKKLLRETTKKIYEISESVGYTSVDYFTNIFKRIEGITPMQYRMNEGFLQNTNGKCLKTRLWQC